MKNEFSTKGLLGELVKPRNTTGHLGSNSYIVIGAWVGPDQVIEMLLRPCDKFGKPCSGSPIVLNHFHIEFL